MHRKLILATILSSIFLSCGSESSDSVRRAELLKDPEGTQPAKPDLLATVPFKKVPVVDSTNFDNFNGKDPLSEKLVSQLQLKSLDPNIKHFYARYRIAFTTAVDLMAVTAPAENEMKTFLVSYAKEDYKVIDKVVIAYDEIAESAFSSIGKVSKNEITVTNYNYMTEEPVIETLKYHIEKSGKFSKK
jgi:hypothetical protein